MVRHRRGSDVRDAIFISVAFTVLALALWLDVQFMGPILGRISTVSMDVHADFDTFWRSARAFWEGRDVYDTGARLENLNPPLWILLISPFAFLEPLVAYRVFILATLIMTVGYLALVADEVRLRPVWTVVGTAMLLFSSPLLATLALGQIYPILALLLVAAWMADRRGQPLTSGGTLGVAVALKPSLAPVLLWPLVRRRWRTFGAALASGAVATLVGLVVVGPGATLGWLRLLPGSSAIIPYWDNASLPSAATRLFTENPYTENIATWPWTIPVAYALGIGAIIVTAVRVRHGAEVGLWALVAASLLASPIAWHNYLVLLGPGILVLLARGRAMPAFLLLALQSIQAQWPLLWNEKATVVASLALTLYLYILIAHWLVLLSATKEPVSSPETGKLG